jgi:hypothetical protein
MTLYWKITSKVYYLSDDSTEFISYLDNCNALTTDNEDWLEYNVQELKDKDYREVTKSEFAQAEF